MASAKTLEECISQYVGHGMRNSGVILWLGTSIPAGGTYPINSCKNLGYTCINNAVGSSGITLRSGYSESSRDGKDLSETIAEKEKRYRPYVQNGTITEATLETYKNYSYERLIIPFLNEIDAIVFDHGYNDRAQIKIDYDLGKNNIDWTNRDRNTYIGGFNYLMNEIFTVNPYMKIIIAGHFTNIVRYSKEICEVQRWTAEHYLFPFMDIHNYSGMSNIYVPGSTSFLDEYNAKYGTSYTKSSPDADGNIMMFQLYCPDGVHPHSDKTGMSNRRLDAIFTKLLKDSL